MGNKQTTQTSDTTPKAERTSGLEGNRNSSVQSTVIPEPGPRNVSSGGIDDTTRTFRQVHEVIGNKQPSQTSGTTSQAGRTFDLQGNRNSSVQSTVIAEPAPRNNASSGIDVTTRTFRQVHGVLGNSQTSQTSGTTTQSGRMSGFHVNSNSSVKSTVSKSAERYNSSSGIDYTTRTSRQAHEVMGNWQSSQKSETKSQAGLQWNSNASVRTTVIAEPAPRYNATEKPSRGYYVTDAEIKRHAKMEGNIIEREGGLDNASLRRRRLQNFLGPELYEKTERISESKKQPSSQLIPDNLRNQLIKGSISATNVQQQYPVSQSSGTTEIRSDVKLKQNSYVSSLRSKQEDEEIVTRPSSAAPLKQNMQTVIGGQQKKSSSPGILSDLPLKQRMGTVIETQHNTSRSPGTMEDVPFKQNVKTVTERQHNTARSPGTLSDVSLKHNVKTVTERQHTSARSPGTLSDVPLKQNVKTATERQPSPPRSPGTLSDVPLRQNVKKVIERQHNTSRSPGTLSDVPLKQNVNTLTERQHNPPRSSGTLPDVPLKQHKALVPRVHVSQQEKLDPDIVDGKFKLQTPNSHEICKETPQGLKMSKDSVVDSVCFNTTTIGAALDDELFGEKLQSHGDMSDRAKKYNKSPKESLVLTNINPKPVFGEKDCVNLGQRAFCDSKSEDHYLKETTLDKSNKQEFLRSMSEEIYWNKTFLERNYDLTSSQLVSGKQIDTKPINPLSKGRNDSTPVVQVDGGKKSDILFPKQFSVGELVDFGSAKQIQEDRKCDNISMQKSREHSLDKTSAGQITRGKVVNKPNNKPLHKSFVEEISGTVSKQVSENEKYVSTTSNRTFTESKCDKSNDQSSAKDQRQEDNDMGPLIPQAFGAVGANTPVKESSQTSKKDNVSIKSSKKQNAFNQMSRKQDFDKTSGEPRPEDNAMGPSITQVMRDGARRGQLMTDAVGSKKKLVNVSNQISKKENVSTSSSQMLIEKQTDGTISKQSRKDKTSTKQTTEVEQSYILPSQQISGTGNNPKPVKQMPERQSESFRDGKIGNQLTRPTEATGQIKFDNTLSPPKETVTALGDKSTKSVSSKQRRGKRSRKRLNTEKSSSQENLNLENKNIKKTKESTAITQVAKDSQKNLSKPTYLYLVPTDNISGRKCLKEYLKHRMGNPASLDFTVVKTMKQRNGQWDIVVILISSRSKATAAKRLIEKGNKNTSNQIVCYFTENEAHKVELVDPEDKEALREKVVDELFEKALTEFAKHDAKIKDRSDQIQIRENNLKRKRGLSLDQYEKNTNEKQALEDRLEELELQKKEFIKYMQKMKTKLMEIENDKDFDSSIAKVRKDFGVECQRLRTALPMYARRDDILSTVKNHQVSVLLGETGSGKSTQIVQYLYQAGFANEGLIACTQPRKIAAVSLATHVSSELASNVGQEVGYKVGMQSKKTALTKILFMTDHVLLNECLKDETFSAYSCVIIDEAHERSIHTDLLLGMLKTCLAVRPDLKVVITSATINPDVFVSYFGGVDICPVLQVSGRTFPVDVFWETELESRFPDDYEDKAVNKAIEVHTNIPVNGGDILVFLTSPQETEKCCRRFKQSVATGDFECLPLHGKLDSAEQKLVFEKVPRGKRKIVFATNSAETSITIPGIKFVIDTGVAKEMRYDPKKNMNSLDVRPVSQSSANQRKGRAGRTESGICYRLYSEADFASMDKSSRPEILRVHLGQSILKLMDLGVNVISFDFVEQPDRDAMTEALNLLYDIDAIEEGNITELGKWIAKLPVEPRLGLLIKKGIDANIPLEAIIVASSSNQTSVFYRGGNEQQKKMADLKKVPFAHTRGDLLTILDVFRTWDKVPEQQKNNWCFQKSINAKSIRGIREMVKETLWILNKELGLKIKYELKTDNKDSTDVIIQKMIFQCMLSNLSRYLGHEKAGYLITDRNLHVQIHPSSALCSLAMQPKWVVYSQLVKTSQDFITNVTPVPEEYVTEAITAGNVQLEMEHLQRIQVKQVCKKTVGKHVFWKFVGPQHKNRREVEETISMACNDSIVVIEADKIRGEISLYCTEIYQDIAADIFQAALADTGTQLLNESIEEYIGSAASGVRVLVRAGGQVVDVLMPGQYRACQIRETQCSRYEITEQYVEEILRDFGDIEQLWRPRFQNPRGGGFWGKVTFVNCQDAVNAVKTIDEETDMNFTLEPLKSDSHGARKQEFKLKLQWCRRKTRGHCFVMLERPEDIAHLLTMSVVVDDIPATVKMPRRGGRADLLVEPIGPEVKEEQVKQALADELDVNLEANRSRFQVIMPRHNAVYGPEARDMIRNKLEVLLAKYVERNTFSIFVREYKEQTAFCSAEAVFSDINECEKAAKGLIINDDAIYGSIIDVDQEFKSNVFLPKYIYAASKRDIDNYISLRKQKRSTTSVSLRTMKSGNLSVDIKACSPARLAKVKMAVDDLIAGDIINCELIPHGQGIFTASARQQMDKIRKRTGTVISTDERRLKVTVQGLSEKRQEALSLIHAYLESVAKAAELQIPLKGEGNPPGFMKALLVKYGLSLHILRDETELVAIQLNLRQHELTLTGSEEALKKACAEVEQVRKHLIEHGDENVVDDGIADCPICLCPVEISDMLRLELCGHAYCSTCLASMLTNAVSSKEFPIVCCSDGCKKPFVARDLVTQLKKGTITRKSLVEATLDSFVSQNSKDFSYCITADCPMVFRQTTSGDMFSCSLCMTSICTTCQVPFHDGLSCAMYKSGRRDQNSLKKWLKEKPDKRKLCPKCEIGIEKIDGCDHMPCKCGAHICWKCMKFFDTGRACYGHMEKAHGSFV